MEGEMEYKRGSYVYAIEYIDSAVNSVDPNNDDQVKKAYKNVRIVILETMSMKNRKMFEEEKDENSDVDRLDRFVGMITNILERRDSVFCFEDLVCLFAQTFQLIQKVIFDSKKVLREHLMIQTSGAFTKAIFNKLWFGDSMKKETVGGMRICQEIFGFCVDVLTQLRVYITRKKDHRFYLKFAEGLMQIVPFDFDGTKKRKKMVLRFTKWRMVVCYCLYVIKEVLSLRTMRDCLLSQTMREIEENCLVYFVHGDARMKVYSIRLLLEIREKFSEDEVISRKVLSSIGIKEKMPTYRTKEFDDEIREFFNRYDPSDMVSFRHSVLEPLEMNLMNSKSQILKEYFLYCLRDIVREEESCIDALCVVLDSVELFYDLRDSLSQCFTVLFINDSGLKRKNVGEDAKNNNDEDAMVDEDEEGVQERAPKRRKLNEEEGKLYEENFGEDQAGEVPFHLVQNRFGKGIAYSSANRRVFAQLYQIIEDCSSAKVATVILRILFSVVNSKAKAFLGKTKFRETCQIIFSSEAMRILMDKLTKMMNPPDKVEDRKEVVDVCLKFLVHLIKINLDYPVYSSLFDNQTAAICTFLFAQINRFLSEFSETSARDKELNKLTLKEKWGEFPLLFKVFGQMCGEFGSDEQKAKIFDLIISNEEILKFFEYSLMRSLFYFQETRTKPEMCKIFLKKFLVIRGDFSQSSMNARVMAQKEIYHKILFPRMKNLIEGWMHYLGLNKDKEKVAYEVLTVKHENVEQTLLDVLKWLYETDELSMLALTMIPKVLEHVDKFPKKVFRFLFEDMLKSLKLLSKTKAMNDPRYSKFENEVFPFLLTIRPPPKLFEYLKKLLGKENRTSSRFDLMLIGLLEKVANHGEDGDNELRRSIFEYVVHKEILRNRSSMFVSKCTSVVTLILKKIGIDKDKYVGREFKILIMKKYCDNLGQLGKIIFACFGLSTVDFFYRELRLLSALFEDERTVKVILMELTKHFGKNNVLKLLLHEDSVQRLQYRNFSKIIYGFLIQCVDLSKENASKHFIRLLGNFSKLLKSFFLFDVKKFEQQYHENIFKVVFYFLKRFGKNERDATRNKKLIGLLCLTTIYWKNQGNQSYKNPWMRFLDKNFFRLSNFYTTLFSSNLEEGGDAEKFHSRMLDELKGFMNFIMLFRKGQEECGETVCVDVKSSIPMLLGVFEAAMNSTFVKKIEGFEEYLHFLLKDFRRFCQAVHKTNTDVLKNYVCRIVVGVVRFYDVSGCAEVVMGLLDDIINEEKGGKTYLDLFRSQYYLENLPNGKCKEVIRKRIASKSKRQTTLSSKINDVLDRLRKNETSEKEVKMPFLMELNWLLRQYRSEKQSLLMEAAKLSGSMNDQTSSLDLFGDLYALLFEALMDDDWDISKQALLCLGSIGSLDPSIVKPLSRTVLINSMREMNGFEIVEFFVNMLSPEYSNDYTRACLHHIMSFVPSSRMDKMPQQLRGVVESGQRVKSKNVEVENEVDDLFMESITKGEWMKKLASRVWIIGLKKIDKVENNTDSRAITETFKILSISLNHVKDDSAGKILIHLIFYAISQAKCERSSLSDVAKAVQREINHVLSFSTKIELCKNYELVFGVTEVIFSILDVLKKWCEDGRQKVMDMAEDIQKRSNSRNSHIESEIFELERKYNKRYGRVKTFLDSMDYGILALAAGKLKSYPRAFLYYELFLSRFVASRRKDGEDCKDNGAGYLLSDQKVFLGNIMKNFHDYYVLSIPSLGSMDQNSIELTIMEYEARKDWGSALGVYENLQGSEGFEFHGKVGRLKCLKALGNLKTMLDTAQTLNLHAQSNMSQIIFKSFGTEAAWRMESWDVLNSYLGDIVSNMRQNEFEVDLAQCLQQFQKVVNSANDKNFNVVVSEFVHFVDDTKANLLERLRWGSKQSYKRCFPDLCNLQLLSELCETSRLLLEYNSESFQSAVKEYLENNYKVSYSTADIDTRERCLYFRKVIYSILNMRKEKGEMYLQLAKCFRKEKMFQNAGIALSHSFNFLEHDDNRIFRENARILFHQGEKKRAIVYLDKLLLSMKGDKSNVAKSMRLLKLKWEQSTQHSSLDDLVGKFKDYSESSKDETGYFYYARCLDLHLESKVEALKYAQFDVNNEEGIAAFRNNCLDKEYAVWNEFIQLILLNYKKSLQCGYKKMNISMNRFITLFCDFGEVVARMESSSSKRGRGGGGQSTKWLDSVRGNGKFFQGIPLYKFTVSLSQLFSQILHENESAKVLIHSLIVDLLRTFPQQLVWLFHSKSRGAIERKGSSANNAARIRMRIKVAKEILEKAKKAKNKRVKGILAKADHVFNGIVTLSGKKSQNRSYVDSARRFNRKLGTTDFIIPTIEALSVEFPPDEESDRLDFNPYRQGLAMKGFWENERGFSVLTSLARPTAFHFRFVDADDKRYTVKFLSKPKDDGRKDARMMELFGTMNLILKKNLECRKMNLSIRRFSVVPLNDDATLVEWVQNTHTLRKLVETTEAKTAHYKEGVMERNRYPSEYMGFFSQLKSVVRDVYDSGHPTYDERKLRRVYLTMRKKTGNDLIRKWYNTTYVEPIRWYESRFNFTKTFALSSIIGYIIGLGDRHLENTLVEESSGGVVLIDFDVTFDKGKALGVAEVVPFRLTRNIVAAMGIAGIEGLFRKTGETVLKLMKDNRATILSVFKPFINDPLNDFVKLSPRERGRNFNRGGGAGGGNGNIGKLKSVCREALKGVDRKLQGYHDCWKRKRTSATECEMIKEESSISLSVEGQIAAIIEEATNDDNLSLMYPYWAPFT